MILKEKPAVNRIAKPGISVTEFIQFASDTGFGGIELRNDLTDPTVRGGQSADEIKSKAGELGIDILTINALQRFNDPSLFEDKKSELQELIDEALSVNCRMIILCPVNDPDDNRTADEQRKDLHDALKNYAPLFERSGTSGLIEPLGFPICSVRYKEQAVEAIKATGLENLYKVTHDTFHHFLAEEKNYYPEHTGLVHISGVYAGKKKEDITDEDRILVDDKDIMDNAGQIKELLTQGCKALISYEPFSSVIQNMPLDELKKEIIKSREYLFS
jgi:2-keto-myo-inositol isomerase